MANEGTEIDELTGLITHHDDSGVLTALGRHRKRLKEMIAARLDPRLAVRVDPSDVVQETLMAAVKQVPDYVKDEPLPVYPWLRQLAAERLEKLSRKHIQAQRRSVLREHEWSLGLSDASAINLAEVVAQQKSPSENAVDNEQGRQVRRALERLPYVDREVLVMRFIEQLTTRETAAILGISADAVRMRRLRALRSLADGLKKMKN